jgi:transcriptional regulator with XRE-family HTH domain
MNFADRFNQLRTEQKITVYKIAKLLDISDTSVWKYSHGESKPTLENLIKLADIFNVSLDYLVGRDEFPDISNFINYFREFRDGTKETGETTIVMSKSNDNVYLFLCNDFEYSPNKPEIASLPICSKDYNNAMEMTGFIKILNFLYDEKCGFKIDFDWLKTQIAKNPIDPT